MVTAALGTIKHVALWRLTLIAFVGLVQCSTSAEAFSDDLAARDLAAAKTFALGGIGVVGLMSDGERKLRAVLDRSDASQQLQASLIHATPAGELYILVACVGVILRSIKKFFVPWRTAMMRLKWRVAV